MKASFLVAATWLALSLTSGPASAQVTLHADIPYNSIPGVDPNLLALDIYVPDGADGTNPVMMMFHGGSFISGDKALEGVVHPKMDYYTALGWVFVSANYRLTDIELPAGHPDQVTHPDHVIDIARSIAWTIENISGYGGDPGSIVIMGFSAGAQLVALVANDQSRLETEGFSTTNLDGVIALDGMYDIPLRYEQFPPPPSYNVLIWGSDLATQEDMSPALHIEAEVCTPPTLVVHASETNPTEQSRAFVGALRQAGHRAEIFNAIGMSHSQIGSSIGIPGHPLTVLVDNFLASLPMNTGTDSGAGRADELRVDRQGNDLVLRWSPSCDCTDSDYAVYEGILGDYLTHAPIACSTDQSLSFRLGQPADSRYYLIAPRSESEEGSLGLDTTGQERTQGTGSCALRQIVQCTR